MRRPDLSVLQRSKVTSVTVLLSIAISAAWWLQVDINHLIASEDWPHRPWTLVTTMFPHVGAMHLIFNIFWLWLLGSFVEKRLGSFKTAIVFIAIASGSAAAQIAISRSGVGLSGLIYGLFGMLWMLGRTNDKFKVIQKSTIYVFVGWFFACILLAALDIMSVANAAHGSGAVLGILLGLAMGERTVLRRQLAAGAFALCIGGVLAWPVLEPVVFGRHLVPHLQRKARKAQERNDYSHAALILNKLIRYAPHDARIWCDLGAALTKTGNHNAAVSAYEEAWRLDPASTEIRRAYASAASQAAKQAVDDGRLAEAIRLGKLAINLEPGLTEAWHHLAEALEKAGRHEEARAARQSIYPQPMRVKITASPHSSTLMLTSDLLGSH